MATIRSLIVKVGADISSLQKGMDKAQRRIKKASANLTQTGMSLTKGITLPVIGIGAAAITASQNFNKGMANVATLIPGNVMRVNDLKDIVQDLAVETGKTTDAVTGGLYQVISAFGDSADTAKILEINAKASAAGLAEVTDSVNLTSAVMKGYGDISAEAAQKAADLAFQTVKLGQTTFPELSASIGRTIPLAAQLGIKQEELFAGFATLTGVTGNTAEVSTQFASMLRAMIKPTTAMSEAIKDLGFSSASAMTEELGLVGSLQALMGTTDGTEESVAKLFGRAEALTGVFALNGSQAEVFQEKLVAMIDSTGAMIEAFKEQTEGVNKAGFAWSKLKTKLEVISQDMGDTLEPAIIKVFDKVEVLIGWLEKGVRWFANLDEKTQNTILTIVGIAAAIGPVLVILGGLVGAISAIISPITLVIVAIGALTSVFITLQKNWDEIWKNITYLFKYHIADIKDTIDGWAKIFVKIFNFIKREIAATWQDIVNGIKSGVNEIIKFVNSMISLLNKIPGIKLGKIGTLDVPQYAAGTSFHPGGPAIVGENGPELVNLPRGSSVIPNAGANRTVNVTFNGPIYGVLDFEQKVKETIKNAMMDGAFEGVA